MKYLSGISYCQTIIWSTTKISLIRVSVKSFSLKVQNGIKLITEICEFSCLSKFRKCFVKNDRV